MSEPRIGLLLHVYYLEVLPSLLRVLPHFPSKLTLLVSTRKRFRKQVEQQIMQAAPEAVLHIESVPNLGFDIAPMLICFAEQLLELDLVCKLHTKNSEHFEPHAGWREQMIENLAGSTAIVQDVLSEFERNPKLGVALGGAYPTLKESMQWNKTHLKVGGELLRELQLPVETLLDFPAGSMFWFRPAALMPLLKRKWDWLEFDFSGDEGLAHVVERLILLCADQQGFTWRKLDHIGQIINRPSRQVNKVKLAVVLHVWSLNGLSKAIVAIKNIPQKFDLFVSYAGQDSAALERVLLQHFDADSVSCSTVENIGHDVAPFVGIAPQLADYDLLCKLHVKQSSQAWFDYLLNNLLGGPIEVNVILAMFARNPQLGLVYPETFPPQQQRLSWGSNFARAAELAKAMNLASLKSTNVEFLSSTMFWCRPRALQALFDCNQVNFKASDNQLKDGAEAHAIERIIPSIVSAAGYRSRAVLFHPTKQQQRQRNAFSGD